MKRDDIVARLGAQYLPLHWTQFFKDEICPPNPETGDPGMIFAGELPPTYQEFLRSPKVQQSQMITTLQMAQRIQQSQQQYMMSLPEKERKKLLRQQLQR